MRNGLFAQGYAQDWTDGGFRWRPPRLREGVEIVVWGAVWIALWRLASILAVNFGISAWYPPAAISLFLMIRFGPPAAAAVFAASLLAGSTQWASYPGHHEILGSLGHAAAYLCAAMLYRRRLDRHRYSIRPKSISAFIHAALLGATLAAILGSVNLHYASGGLHDVDFGRVFSWMTGDLFGVLSICPILLFMGHRIGVGRLALRPALSTLKAPVAALAVAIALATGFAVISRGSDIDFRLVCVVGVGVYGVIVANVVSPRSAVIYLFFIAAIAASWLSTEVAPAVRVEFAVQICTFLIASFAMIYLSMEETRARVAVANRRLRIRDLSRQRDALSRRISAVEAEFAQVAHELKTPLGGIIGMLEMTEGGVVSGDQREQVARYFKHMRGCARYLNAMVDDAFDVARLARGRFEPVIDEVDMGDLLAELELISRSKAGADVSFPADGEVSGVRARTDRNRLLQILINLVVNGVRYSDRRGSVRVACAVSHDYVTLSVENASSAVTKAQIDARIGGGHDVSANSMGLGIGLPLVGRLAAGIGARLATAVSDGVVTISVTVPRA